MRNSFATTSSIQIISISKWEDEEFSKNEKQRNRGLKLDNGFRVPTFNRLTHNVSRLGSFCQYSHSYKRKDLSLSTFNHIEYSRACFHSTAYRENPLFLGVGLLAISAYYVGRGMKRLREEDLAAANAIKSEKRNDDGTSENSHLHVNEDSEVGYPVVGLDLGTVSSCVSLSVDENSLPYIVENEEGKRTIPAYITPTSENELVFGTLAKKQKFQDPTSVAYTLSRLFSEEYSTDLRSKLPFPIESNPDNNALQLVLKGQKLSASHMLNEQIKSMIQIIAKKLPIDPKSKSTIYNKLGLLVVSHPPYYTSHNKNNLLASIQNSLQFTNPEKVKLVNEAVAALLAAYFEDLLTADDLSESKQWIVLDIGGLCSTISTIELDGESHILEVRNSSTNWKIGGEHMDTLLAMHLASEFTKSHPDINLMHDFMALARLYEAAETAKIELNNSKVVNINLPFISADTKGPKHLQMDLTLVDYQKLIENHILELKDTIYSTISVIEENPAAEVGGILLTGGPTKLGLIREIISTIVSSKEKASNLKVVHLPAPDETIALGATYYGREFL